jgi:hypothetical protein
MVITGFLLEKIFLQFGRVHSIMMSIFIVFTIIVEIGLFIIEIGKMTESNAKREGIVR